MQVNECHLFHAVMLDVAATRLASALTEQVAECSRMRTRMHRDRYVGDCHDHHPQNPGYCACVGDVEIEALNTTDRMTPVTERRFGSIINKKNRQPSKDGFASKCNEQLLDVPQSENHKCLIYGYILKWSGR